MDRNKIMIKIIEDPISRQQFYSKCKDSIVKKSNELGLLCDTNIALLMVSPNGEVTSCSGGERLIRILEWSFMFERSMFRLWYKIWCDFFWLLSFEDIMSNAMNQFDELNRQYVYFNMSDYELDFVNFI